MMDDLSRRILAGLQSRSGGTIAVYKEKQMICRVRIVDIRLDETGVSARCETIETPGLNRGGASWDIRALLSDCYVTRSFWSGGSYAGWQIFLDPAVIQRVLDMVTVLPAGKTYADDYTRRPAPRGSRFTAIHSPGTCALGLLSYLHEQAVIEMGRPESDGCDDSSDGERSQQDRRSAGDDDRQSIDGSGRTEASPSRATPVHEGTSGVATFIGLFADSDDPRIHRNQILGLRRAVMSLAQDIQVLTQLLREAKVLDPARYRTLRMSRMVADHSGAGAAPFVHYSYYPYFLTDEEYLRAQLAASEEEIQAYKREVDFVSQLS